MRILSLRGGEEVEDIVEVVAAERWEAVRWVRRSAEGESIAVLGRRESVGMREVVGGLPCF
jgi:hypothetical protein